MSDSSEQYQSVRDAIIYGPLPIRVVIRRWLIFFAIVAVLGVAYHLTGPWH